MEKKRNRGRTQSQVALSKIYLTSRLICLFLFGTLIQVSASKYSASTKISVSGSELSIEEVFKIIEDQSEFSFFYNVEQLDLEKRFNFDIKNEKVEKVMKIVLESSELTYTVKDRLIVIHKKDESNPVDKSAVQQSLTGKVTDENGEPLPGATVVVKGTAQGVVTDMDGNYSISNIPENATMVFAFVGMLSQEIPVGNQTTINVSMIASSIGIEEVISIGYGVQKKESITGAISGIESEKIETVKAATVSAALAGQIPGVSFRQRDARPGAAADIQIRNFGNPLIIVDGVEKDMGSFNNISPNDIESISVLKDASAAIYGVRAGNGVIIVTTKRGKLNTKNTINITAFQGFQTWLREPEFVNASQWMEGKARAEMNAINPGTSITQAELDKWEQGTEYGYRSFDWYDFMVQPNAPQTSVNFNTSGGSDKINYYLSVSHVDQSSVLGREYKAWRTNIQSNIDAKITDRLTIGTSISGRIEVRDNPGVPWGDDYIMPLRGIYRSRPTERPYANDNPDYVNNIGHNENNWGLFTKEISGYSTNHWRVIQTNFDLKYDVPIEGLTFKGTYSYYFADRLMNEHEYTYETFTYLPEEDEYKMTFAMQNPWRRREHQKVLETVMQFNLNYVKSFGDHNINATFVNERTQRKNIYSRYNALPSTNALILMYDEDLMWFTDDVYEQARIGYVGRFNYSFSRKYYLEMVGRYDGSWKFTNDKRWGFFPSVSGGWRISEENFMKNIVDKSGLDMKIRASYGIVGDDNVGIGPYDYISGYNYGVNQQIIDDNKEKGSRDRGVPVTNITWFTNRILDIGIDYSFMNNKFGGSVDFFDRRREGLTGAKYDILVPNEIGYSLPLENVNSDGDIGVDASVVYNGKAGDFSYTIGLNGTYARRRTLETYKPRFGNSWDNYRNSAEDRWSGRRWGYESIGQFESLDQIRNFAVDNDGQGNTTLLPGDLIYKDINNDGVINEYDQRPIGYPGNDQPILSFGFINNFKYKNFDLAVNFSGGGMGSFLIDNWYQTPYYGTGNLLQRYYDDSWKRTDVFDLNSEWIPGTYPALRYNQRNINSYGKTSTFWLVNVWYLRARSIEFGYNLPSSFLNKIKMDKLRLFVNTYNLFSIDNMSKYDLDPEISHQDNRNYPQSRAINIGFDLTF